MKKKIRVMIVEHNPVIAKEMSSKLKKIGYLIPATASDGAEALEKAAAGHVDIVLVNSALPGEMDGITTAEQIHARYDIPVIYLTSCDDEEMLVRAKVNVLYGYIVEPFEEYDLRIALEIALCQHHADKRVRESGEKLKKYRAHLEAVSARRTAELKKTNARLHRLLHFIELTERKLATDALEMDLHEDGDPGVSAEEGVITADPDLRVVLINAAASQLLGCTEDEAKEKEVSSVFVCGDPAVASRLDASMKAMIKSGSPGETSENVEVRSKVGEISLFTVHLEPIFDTDKTIAGIVITFLDAAESKKREYEAITTRKLESLNLTMRGIAHDFNNILSSFLANVQLAKMEVRKGSPGYDRLNRAEESVHRARELSQQMLTCSSSEIPQAGTSDLLGVIGLPATRRVPVTSRKPKQHLLLKPVGTGKKKILLMDDIEDILSATGEMLGFLGYEVAVAHQGEAAVDLYAGAMASGVPFDAVILDITVPGGMGAQETLPKLVALDPHVKAIISSGYTTDPMIVEYRSFGFVSAIIKPYGFRELGEALDTAFR